MEIGEIVGICVAWVVLTNAHLGFGWDLPLLFTLGGGKRTILGNIFDNGLKWQLPIPQLGGIWKIEKRFSATV